MKSRANIIVGAIVVVVLVASAVAFAFMNAPGGTVDASRMRAVVHDGEGTVYELPLEQDCELPVTTSLGTNVVVVEKGAVYVREADCENQDCVHQGKLSAPGRQIICLPHKLWIEVVAEGDSGAADMDVDSVAGEEGLDAIAR